MCIIKIGIIYLEGHTAECALKTADELNKLCTEYTLVGIKDYDELTDNPSIDNCLKECDITIAVGGDGTIIHTAKAAAKYNKPVLGINSGHVGFMAGLESEEISLLPLLIEGKYRIEKRMLLKVTVNNRNNEEVFYGYALNEAVIARGSVAKTADLYVKINDSQPIEYRADGVIVSTPTGSTAYSLSAGGPVIDPEIQGIILTPLCPHSINSRSVIMGENAQLKITSAKDNRCDIYLCIDGESAVEVTDSTVNIQRADDFSVELIRIKNDGFYDIFNRKILKNIS